MTRTYKLDSFLDVQTLNELAKKCNHTVTVFDAKHSWADAKSILGLMSLLYAEPVRVNVDSGNDYVDGLFLTSLPFVEVKESC